MPVGGGRSLLRGAVVRVVRKFLRIVRATPRSRECWGSRLGLSQGGGTCLAFCGAGHFHDALISLSANCCTFRRSRTALRHCDQGGDTLLSGPTGRAVAIRVGGGSGGQGGGLYVRARVEGRRPLGGSGGVGVVIHSPTGSSEHFRRFGGSLHPHFSFIAGVAALAVAMERCHGDLADVWDAWSLQAW